MAYGAATDEPVFRWTSGYDLAYYHQDALGNVTTLSDTSGIPVETYRYDVFGQPSLYDPYHLPRSASFFGNPLLFTAREYLPQASLYQYRHRSFSPSLGRFLEFDPLSFSAGDPNLLRYVGNSPLNWVDPWGLDAVMTLSGLYLGNAVNASEFAGGSERGHMKSAYSPKGQDIQVDPDRPEAALPARLPKSLRDLIVANPKNGAQTQCKVTDVGPFNENDPYWRTGARPKVEAQFANHTMATYEIPSQNAAIDLTPAAMNNLEVSGPINKRQAPVVWWFTGEAFSGFYPIPTEKINQ